MPETLVWQILGVVLSLLLAGNIFFIRRLILSIDNAAKSSSEALSRVVRTEERMSELKEAIQELPGMKTDVAVIKKTLKHRGELLRIVNMLEARN